VRDSCGWRVLAPLLVVLGAGCSGRDQPPAPPAVPVVVEGAARRDVAVLVRVVGNVESMETVAVRPQVGGEILAVSFREGSDVRAGDELFRLDPRPYTAALHQAEAALARDEATARNARLQAQRAQALFDQGILSQEQYDALHNTADAQDATVRADHAAVETARINLDYCTIRSPIDGRTGSLLVQRGNVVKAVDGGPLVVVSRIDPIYVSFSVPEKRLAEVRGAVAAGTVAVEARITGEEQRPLPGRLTFVDNAVDRATGTLRLKGTFANRDRRLWPGQFVNVLLAVATRHDAIVVPSEAIQTGQAGTFVFVVKPDLIAETRPVTVGQDVDGQVMVETGLEAGETVVVDGQIRLVPGARVELKPPVTGAPAPGARP
jgi:membrane fusion protein, multidrug efflux system